VTSAPDTEGDGGRRREPEVEEAFNRLVSEGSNRLDRPLVPLLATGFVGGIDVGVGVWHTVNGARSGLVTGSLVISLLSLWVAVADSRMSFVARRSGSSWRVSRVMTARVPVTAA
jgi:hypothetical protein